MSALLRKLRGPFAGAAATCLVLAATNAFAGSGVGDVFNLGKANTVDALSSLAGTVDGSSQLQVDNQSTAKSSFAVSGRITSSSAGASSAGVRGVNSASGSNGYGVWGIHSGKGYGVYGSSGGTGVFGKHTAGTGTDPGVLGQTASTDVGASGVQGKVGTAGADQSAGVYGLNQSTTSTGEPFGVLGDATASPEGIGVAGRGTITGVEGRSDYWGVVGEGGPDGVGVMAFQEQLNGTGPALEAENDSEVAGAHAIEGLITSSTPGSNSAAVYGSNAGQGGLGIGVYGEQNGSGWGVNGVSPHGIGVRGATTDGWAGSFAGRVSVGGYLRIKVISGGAPPAADCDAAVEAGQMVVRTDGTTNLYICRGTAGWIGK